MQFDYPKRYIYPRLKHGFHILHQVVKLFREYFTRRKVGLVEAAYDIMGYHKQQISLDVITHLERYPHRDSAVRHLAILQQEHKDTDEVYVDEFDPVIIRLNHFIVLKEQSGNQKIGNQMETFPYKISLDKSETLPPYKQKFIVYFRYKTGHGVSNDIDNCCVILHVMRAAKATQFNMTLINTFIRVSSIARGAMAIFIIHVRNNIAINLCCFMVRFRQRDTMNNIRMSFIRFSTFESLIWKLLKAEYFVLL
ncbi:hypothetical protein EDC94DRAFT_581016 [Helicostylum pulchrum]|nr:hypothetical protein EDC94DRAFT_581016 [Helicostylum pulchrum]